MFEVGGWRKQIEKNRLLSSSDRPLFIQEFLYYKIFFQFEFWLCILYTFQVCPPGDVGSVVNSIKSKSMTRPRKNSNMWWPHQVQALPFKGQLPFVPITRTWSIAPRTRGHNKQLHPHKLTCMSLLREEHPRAAGIVLQRSLSNVGSVAWNLWGIYFLTKAILMMLGGSFCWKNELDQKKKKRLVL